MCVFIAEHCARTCRCWRFIQNDQGKKIELGSAMGEGGREGGAQIVCVFKHFIIVFMSCTHM